MSKKQYGIVLVVAMVAGLVGGMVSNWFLMGTPVFAQKAPQREKDLQAERFEVVDQAGKLRAILGVVPDGTLSLVLNDKAGRPRAGLTVVSNGAPFVALFDKDGKLRTKLALEPDGAPSLTLADDNGQARANLNLNQTT